ncbi:MAG: hypothetical protein V3V77_03440, partial [Candidatus Bipolaricaulota bacterium]
QSSVISSSFLHNHLTNRLFNLPFLDSRLCFQLNEPNELNELNRLITHHCSSTSGCRIKSGMTAYPGSGPRAGIVRRTPDRGPGQAPESSVIVVLRYPPPTTYYLPLTVSRLPTVFSHVTLHPGYKARDC